MLDQIQELEQRVEMLMRLLDKVRQDNAQLRTDVEAQRGELKALAAEREHNAQLEAQIKQLESEMENVTGRETQIRDRLKVILGKIDSIEAEIGSGGED